MFEGIDDSSDDESLNSYEGVGEEEDQVAGRIEVEGREISRQEQDTGKGERGNDEEKQEGERSQTIVV